MSRTTMLYRMQQRKYEEECQPWHYENKDYSPLCYRPNMSIWLRMEPPNPMGLKTTDNVKYVTCKRCRKILAERGVELPELIKEETE